MMFEPKVCEWCGKTFIPRRSRLERYCSDECRLLRTRQVKNNWSRNNRDYRRERESLRLKMKRERIIKNTVPIKEIMEKASKEGMSYGQYVARYQI